MMFCCWDAKWCKVASDDLALTRLWFKSLGSNYSHTFAGGVFFLRQSYITPSTLQVPMLWKTVCSICRDLGKKKCFQVGTRVVVWGTNETSGAFVVFKLVMQLIAGSSRSIASGLIFECCIGLDVWLVMDAVIFFTYTQVSKVNYIAFDFSGLNSIQAFARKVYISL
jgi:hypothetical protein